MARFLTELLTRDLDDRKAEVLADLVYESDLLGRTITVPKGFVTDFASVPRVPIVYLLFGDRAHRESVVHDYLYQRHMVTRGVADKVFLEAMKARGKSAFVRVGMYWGVVLGGRGSYKSGPSRYEELNDGPEHKEALP